MTSEKIPTQQKPHPPDRVRMFPFWILVLIGIVIIAANGMR